MRLLLPLTLFIFLPLMAMAETRAASIGRVEQYLANITTLSADFTQTTSDGSLTQGRFYLAHAGKMRWEYNPPTPILIVSSGTQLVYYDKELEQVSYIPLSDSMIGFLARSPLRLGGDIKVVALNADKGALSLSLQQANKPEQGKLVLEFTDHPLELRNLITTDASGQVTHVALSNARFGEVLNKELFIFRDPRKSQR